MTQQQFSKLLGIGKSALSMIETGRVPLSTRNRNIFIQLLNISPEWIEQGTGDMQRPGSAFPARGRSPRSKVSSAVGSSTTALQTLHPSNLTALWRRGIPLYPIDHDIQLSALLNRRSKCRPDDYIYIPGAPKCDGALRICGDNMTPLLHSGDIVLFSRTLFDTASPAWGELYLLVIGTGREESLLLGTLQPAMADAVRIVNSNPHYADRVVPRAAIRAAAIIKITAHISAMR